MPSIDVKPVPDRLYGRQISRPLRARQKYLLQHILPQLRPNTDLLHQPQDLFPEDIEEIALEIGFGGGEHTLGQLNAHKHCGFIACEVFVNGLCSLLAKLAPQEGGASRLPSHLKIWDQDARQLMRQLPRASISSAYLLFPDPWPKKRHSKRRFIHPQNIEEMARIMKRKGRWYVASDHPIYQNWVEEIMCAQPWFDCVYQSDKRPQALFPTRYEQKAFKEGRQPFYWEFVRNET